MCGNEALARELKRRGENIAHQKAKRIRMVLRVFEFSKLVSWISRRTYPTTMRSTQSEVLSYISATIANDNAWCQFPDGAGVVSRIGEPTRAGRKQERRSPTKRGRSRRTVFAQTKPTGVRFQNRRSRTSLPPAAQLV